MSQVLELSKNMKIFQKSENLSEIFQKSKNLPKLWKSENLPKIWTIFQKYENLPKICLIKCLKGHKSLGSLCNVAKALIVSGVRQSKGQTMSPIELFWTVSQNHLSSTKVTLNCVNWRFWEIPNASKKLYSKICALKFQMWDVWKQFLRNEGWCLFLEINLKSAHWGGQAGRLYISKGFL